MSLLWKCDKCGREYHVALGSKFSADNLIRVSGSQYEFCSLDCLKKFAKGMS